MICCEEIIQKVTTPSFLIDMDELRSSLALAKRNAEELNVNLLMAVKGFPLGCIYPELSSYLTGFSATGLFEAKLGKRMGKEVHVHTPVYQEKEFDEILSVCDYVVFNSLNQAKKFIPVSSQTHFGLRVNPECSQVKEQKYNPCAKNSRFGVLEQDMADLKDLKNISGFHVHALCESSSSKMTNLVNQTTQKFEKYFNDIEWINLGGGQIFATDNFVTDKLKQAIAVLTDKYHLRTYVEPCEYLVTNAGYFVTTVQDIIKNGKNIAILDASVTCHTPDILLSAYTPEVVKPKCKKNGYEYILTGCSCLTGDVFGTYTFAKPLNVGDKIIFSEMGAYTFAQMRFFNGINFPSIYLFQDKNLQLIKSFSFDDYDRIYG